jgi:hypothetical protein
MIEDFPNDGMDFIGDEDLILLAGARWDVIGKCL